MREAGLRGRQRFTAEVAGLRFMTRLELLEQVEDPGAPLGRVVEPYVELGDAPDPQSGAQLVPDVRHRAPERAHGGVALVRLADHEGKNCAHHRTKAPSLGWVVGSGRPLRPAVDVKIAEGP